MQAVILVVCISEFCSINEGRTRHVYQTARATSVSLQHRCLHYCVLDDVIYHRETNTDIHELIPNCIRPARADEWQPIANQEIDHTNALTFMNPRPRNVSSERLYAWSAPVDVVEQDPVYLENKSSKTYCWPTVLLAGLVLAVDKHFNSIRLRVCPTMCDSLTKRKSKSAKWAQ